MEEVVEEYRLRFRVESRDSEPEVTLSEIRLDQIEESLRAFLSRIPSLANVLKVYTVVGLKWSWIASVELIRFVSSS